MGWRIGAGVKCHWISHIKKRAWFICCSVTRSYPTLCDPMDYSMSSFPVLHHLPEFAQTHVHWVSDAIQPADPLSSPSPPAFNLLQHRVFSSESALRIRWPNIGASASASVLPMNVQGWLPLRTQSSVPIFTWERDYWLDCSLPLWTLLLLLPSIFPNFRVFSSE